MQEYADKHRLSNAVHFTDDGVSGTRFDRPGFTEMMKEVEAGHVAVIMVKDMSRLGRDYLKVGQIQEQLRQRGVRLIAVNDNVDSENGDDDFVPFRNIMNEFYAKDTSRKIRSTFAAKGRSGKHVASTTPYGYLKAPNNHNQWIVDEEAAEIVRRIYRLTIEGHGPYQISQMLKRDRIEIPAVHMAKNNAGLWQGQIDKIKDPYAWGSSTVVGILKKREYLGETVNFKTRKHFKDKKSHYVSPDQWTVFEGTQEPIIDEETFNTVQRIRSNVRRYPNGWGPVHPLTGIMFCADCGRRLYEHRTNNGKRVSQFTCCGYSKTPVGTYCKTAHRVLADHVLKLIAETLKACAEQVQIDRDAFIQSVSQERREQHVEDTSQYTERIRTAKNRADELEKLICRIYEDHVLEKIPDARYEALNSQYSQELANLKDEVAFCEKHIAGQNKQQWSVDRFAELVYSYDPFEPLTPAVINQFVEKVVVHERTIKGSQHSPQQIDIYFNFIGNYIPPILDTMPTPEEQEALIAHERFLEKQKAAYQRRKANGTQQVYEAKYMPKRKARVDAQKAAYRAEDVTKGIFIPMSTQPISQPMKGEIQL